MLIWITRHLLSKDHRLILMKDFFKPDFVLSPKESASFDVLKKEGQVRD